jgi:uncharacterized protein YjiS (DUF1127 family)
MEETMLPFYPLPSLPALRRRGARQHTLRLIIALALHRCRVWTERNGQRRALARLDERLLRDIGVNRYDAAHEIGKPFWK